MTDSELINRIIVPTDGSDSSMRAADFAIKLGKHFNSEIVAIYVIDLLVLQEVTKIRERHLLEEEIWKKAERTLNYIVGSAKKEGLRATSLILEGQPHDQIVRHAQTVGADMIAMGSKGRRGTERILIGSVAERVIEYAPCPVLVVR